MFRKSLKDTAAVVVRVLREHNTPHQIASGVAIGCFIGILPLYGLHTVLCVIAALMLPRVNKLAILLGTNVSLPPTVVTITWTAYDIGRFFLADRNFPPLSWEYIRHFNMSRISEFYYPLFIGSVVLGALCAVVLYGITFMIAVQLARQHEARRRPVIPRSNCFFFPFL